MKNIPSYAKILTLGSAYTENALIGEVIIQEKIDGSQFRFGINDEGNLKVGSKGTLIAHPDENKMFKEGSSYIFSLEAFIKAHFPSNSYFYGEYLQKPKYNVLCYEKVPKNHIVLFDAVIEGRYQTREQLLKISQDLDIDLVPELFKGTLKDRAVGGGFTNPLDHLKRIIETTPSYLGNELVEGVVIKNYTQTILLGGNVFPLFTKYVRASFKERHEVEWKIKKPRESLEEYIKGFKNENRWIKAILHLKEKQLLTNSPKDIGNLIKEIQNDILTEETENIKTYIFNKFKDDILQNSVRGVADWYKEKLLENLNDNQTNT